MELVGALTWRAARLWLVVRAVVTAVTAGGRTLDTALAGNGVGRGVVTAELLVLQTPVLLNVIAGVIVLTLVQVDRSGEEVIFANLGLGLRHVAVIAAVTAVALETAVRLAVG